MGEKIQYYRKKNKLSQEELAARVGVSRQAVSKWELDDATPEVDKLLALAGAFGVTTDELLSPEAPQEEAASPGRRRPPPPAGSGGRRARAGWAGWPGGGAGWRGCTSPSAARGSPWWAPWPALPLGRCSR